MKVTALGALSRQGRYWIERHKWGGYHVIDSEAHLPISRLMGNHLCPLSAFNQIKNHIGGK